MQYLQFHVLFAVDSAVELNRIFENARLFAIQHLIHGRA